MPGIPYSFPFAFAFPFPFPFAILHLAAPLRGAGALRQQSRSLRRVQARAKLGGNPPEFRCRDPQRTMNSAESSNQHRPSGVFPATRWTVVLSAKEGGDEARARAMEGLARAYWQPIYAYLRGSGRTHEEAQDVVQGFFAHLLGRDFLRNVQPQGGRFRNFLLVCLRRWMRDEQGRVVNVKHRAEVVLQPWHDTVEASLTCPVTLPDEAFDRTWAEALVARAMAQLEENWAQRSALFAALRFTVEGHGDAEKYAAIAARLGMTEGAVNKAAHDLRKQFASQVRAEIRDTVARDDDVEEERRYLVRLMRM